MGIPFINVADVNCWIVNILPFDESEKKNGDLVRRVQQRCIQDGFFGMGWEVAGLFPFGEEISEKKSKEYKDNKTTVSSLAIEGYEKIKKVTS